MDEVVVVGGSVAGLGCGLALARRGIPVRVLDADVGVDDPQRVPLEPRPGVVQHAHAHNFLTRTPVVLQRHFPDVLDALLAAGAWRYRFPLAPADDLAALVCRRPVFEAVLRRVALAEPGLTLEQGVRVDGVDVDRSGRVRAVRTGDGRRLSAAFVVDASGRQTRFPRWAEDAGRAPVATEATTSSLSGYALHFALDPAVPFPTGSWYLGPVVALGPMRAVVFHGDNHTFTLLLIVPRGDEILGRVRHREAFLRVARAVPALAPWLEPSTPISDVQSMATLRNVVHHWFRGDGPALLGVQPIGDALSHTNPQHGWGASFALAHAVALADALADDADPAAVARRFHDEVGAEARLRYEVASRQDAEVEALQQGGVVDVRSPSTASWLLASAAPAGMVDPVVAEAVVRHQNLLAPWNEIRDDPDIVARVEAVLPTLPPPPPPPLSPAQLVDLLTAVPA